MMSTHETLVNALEKRFDFHSARVVAREAQKAAGLDDRAEYSAEDLRRLAEHLPVADHELLPVLQTLGLVEA
jgi:hypothetical protein